MSRVHPLRLMETLEEADAAQSGYTGSARWMIPYADLMTLLLGFFILMFAMVKTEQNTTAHTTQNAQKTMTQLQQQKDLAEQKATYLAHQLATRTLSVSQVLNQAQVEAAQHQTKPNPQALEALEMKLADELRVQGQQVTVSQDARGLVISFQERIFFEPAEAALSERAKETLAKLASSLRSVHAPIRVEGHTDNSPIRTSQFPSNWELSTARATAIVRTLVEDYGFPADHLSAAGYGEYAPLSDNSTIEGKQKNRRVDIVIVNPGVSPSETNPKTTSPFLSGTKE